MTSKKFCEECMCEAIECGAPHNWKESIVGVLPKCDYCDLGDLAESAEYDALVISGVYKGAWAFMCQTHYTQFGIQTLGLGKGQKLVTKKKG